MDAWRSAILLACVVPALAGCGTYVPRIAEAWDTDYPGDPSNRPDPTPAITASCQIEYEIKQNIYCELRKAAQDVDKYWLDDRTGTKPRRTKLLPDDWGASMALSIQADENTTLNPGVAFNAPFRNAVTNVVGTTSVVTPQSRSFGLGATISATATRVDKFNSFFTIGYLRDNSPHAIHQICDGPEKDPFRRNPVGIEPARSSLLVGGLGLTPWLTDALHVTQLIPSYGTSDPPEPKRKALERGHGSRPPPASARTSQADGKGGSSNALGQDTVSIEIKFIVVSSGNLNPTWKLVRVSADLGSNPLLGAGRTRTHDLILTIGPRGTQTDNANLALQIGQAVSSGNRAALASP